MYSIKDIIVTGQETTVEYTTMAQVTSTRGNIKATIVTEKETTVESTTMAPVTSTGGNNPILHINYIYIIETDM